MYQAHIIKGTSVELSLAGLRAFSTAQKGVRDQVFVAPASNTKEFGKKYAYGDPAATLRVTLI